MRTGLLLSVPACVLAASAALAQGPVIDPNGIVNAASFAGGIRGRPVVVGGGIFAILGQNLAEAEETAPPGVKLPYSLSGTSVTVGGMPAPVLYVSPNQIKFQVPRSVDDWGLPVPVVVSTRAGASEPVLADVQFAAPGIFTQDGSGCGAGLVQNVMAQGVYALNTPEESASPGGYIVVYGTGLGAQGSAPPDGEPGPFDRRLGVIASVVGPRGFDHWVYPRLVWDGRAAGLVGVDELIYRLPEDTPEGCAVPLKLLSSQRSQPVTISIHRNGGSCQDPPPARFASLSWKKVITVSPDVPGGLAEETFSGTFVAAPENQLIPSSELVDPRPGFRSCPGSAGGFLSWENPRCVNTGLTAMDAGRLTLDGMPGGSVTVLPSSAGTEFQYAATLPAGALESGTLRVAAEGGLDIGAFETSISIPPPIEITTPLPPGKRISRQYPFTVEWKNGSPDAVVQVQLIGHRRVDRNEYAACRVLASEGQVTLTPYLSYVLGVLPGPAEVVVIVRPRSGISSFSAPGLTRDGRHDWTYEYHFTGLEIW